VPLQVPISIVALEAILSRVYNFAVFFTRSAHFLGGRLAKVCGRYSVLPTCILEHGVSDLPCKQNNSYATMSIIFAHLHLSG
jgi:hypothetical protein